MSFYASTRKVPTTKAALLSTLEREQSPDYSLTLGERFGLPVSKEVQSHKDRV